MILESPFAENQFIFEYKSREMSNPHCTRRLATPAWEV